MEAALTSTAGLVPILLSLIGVLVTLQYLKGMSDFSDAIKFIFWGFIFVFASKLLMFAAGSLSEGYYYFVSLFLHLVSAVFLIAGALRIKGIKLFNRTVIMTACILAAVWSWYVVIITRDGNTLTLSLALSTAGYAVLAASLWRRKSLRNSIGFVITGWFCIFLVLYNLLTLMSWGQSLVSPAFETFLYIAIMCGWILISNNMMACQFDALSQEAEESKERLRLMIQMSPFPIIISRLKDDQLMLINNKAGALFGLDVKHPGNFKTVDYFAEPSKRTELLTKLEKHPVVDDFEFLVKPRKGDPFWLLLSARVIDFEYEIALYMAFQDITDRKKKELQLFNQATRDPLTNCYNRRQFEEMAKNEVQRSRRYNHAFCLFMIDADHFKNVNDTYGHAVGDLVLQALADCCRRTLRESDIVARFGGEEFVILLPEAAIENAHRVAERLRIKISKLVVKGEQGQDVQFTVSIGLVSSKVSDNIAEMLKMADEALYVAKENGRNRVVIFEEGGPNKDIPPPEGEDIEKVRAEPLFYFKPKNLPAPKNKDEEPKDTGVVGLSGESGAGDEPSLDEDEEIKEVPAMHGQGVSLSALYDDEDDDGGPMPITSPAVPPPVFASEEEELPLDDEPEAAAGQVYIEEETAFVETAEDEVPEVSDAYEEEPLLPEESETAEETEAVEDDLIPGIPVQEEETLQEPPLDDEYEPYGDAAEAPAFENLEIVEEPAGEESLSEEYEIVQEDLIAEEETIPEPSFDAGDVIEDDLETGYELPEPVFAEEPELPPEPEADEEEGIPAPPAAVMPEELPEIEEEVPVMPETQEPVIPAPVAPMPQKRPVIKVPVKKLPIKMPAGMAKMPKMPGVVRVKIPKALHQSGAPVSPKPDQP